MTAWAEALAAWKIPDSLLAQATESPYGWPVALWERRSAAADDEEETPTERAVLAFGPASVLDIGAGTGRSCLRYAERGLRVTAVEKHAGMADGLRRASAARGVQVDVIEGSWPDVDVSMADVATSSHVVYDVPDLGPFLTAMGDAANLGVVIELSADHPWAHLAPYYRAIHGLERPGGPTVDDFVVEVEVVIGRTPKVERWVREGGLWFEDWEEILDLYSQRLIVPRSRREELRTLLESDVVESAGRMSVGASERAMATVSWPVRR